ncbi:MAG: hypothetical protein JOZ12_02495, partial [Sinobacteraceae bacterium]|nr:hypothetical protein [Nevskiaceae bacterium]
MNWTVAALAVATIVGAAITEAADSASSPAQKGEWSMPAADYAGTRFSTLAQINLQTATRLRPLWTFSTGVLGGHEGQPLVVNDTMYVVTPWP